VKSSRQGNTFIERDQSFVRTAGCLAAPRRLIAPIPGPMTSSIQIRAHGLLLRQTGYSRRPADLARRQRTRTTNKKSPPKFRQYAPVFRQIRQALASCMICDGYSPGTAHFGRSGQALEFLSTNAARSGAENLGASGREGSSYFHRVRNAEPRYTTMM
jgi:hypothetical protein